MTEINWFSAHLSQSMAVTVIVTGYHYQRQWCMQSCLLKSDLLFFLDFRTADISVPHTNPFFLNLPCLSTSSAVLLPTHCSLSSSVMQLPPSPPTSFHLPIFPFPVIHAGRHMHIHIEFLMKCFIKILFLSLRFFLFIFKFRLLKRKSKNNSLTVAVMLIWGSSHDHFATKTNSCGSWASASIEK